MGNPYAPKPPGTPAPRPVSSGPAHESGQGPLDGGQDQHGSEQGRPGPEHGQPTAGPGHPVGDGLDAPVGQHPGATAGLSGHQPARRPGSTPRPPVDPEQARLATRSVMVFGLFMLVSLLLSSVALPWRMLSVAVGVAALVVGARAFRTVWRAGMRGAIVVVLSAGMLMTVILALSTLAVIPVWQVEMDRQTCLDQAITLTAESSCQTAYETAIDDYRSSMSD